MKLMLPTVAALSALAAASLSQAATLTYTVTATGGNFTVTATDSTGDNFGLAAYKFTLTNAATITQVSPQATFTTSTFSAFASTGFTLLVSADNDPAVTGSQDTATAGAVLNYGIAQSAGTLLTKPPANTPVAVGVTRATYLAPAVLVTGTYSGVAPVLSLADGNIFTTATTNATATPTIVVVQAATPEPASLAVLALSGVGLLRRRRSA